MNKFIISLFLALSGIACFSAEPIFINNYEQAIQSPENVLVIFGTDWCGNCVKLKSNINNINLDNYIVCILDAEHRKDLTEDYKVKAYPTSIIFKDGKEISRKIGYKKIDFERWVEKNRTN